MKNNLIVLAYIILLAFTGLVGYGVINWIVFLNVIEEQLPESEERVPDLGIVENTDLDEDSN